MFEWLINQTEKKFLLNKNNEFLIEELKAAGIEDNNILDAIKKVPRELFVKKDFIKEAYKNIPLPIDCGQTISQPYIVAYMISCLNLKKTDKILEKAQCLAKKYDPEDKMKTRNLIFLIQNPHVHKQNVPIFHLQL